MRAIRQHPDVRHKPRRGHRGIMAMVAITGLLLTACGGGDTGTGTSEGSPEPVADGDESETADNAAASLVAPAIAYTAPDPVSTIDRTYGLVEWGETFGLSVTLDDITIFNDHATAAQAVVSGQQDVLSGAFAAMMQLREKGQDFKAFCPFINSDDYVLAARDDVVELEQIFEPDVAVAVDSEGGAVDLVGTAMFTTLGYDMAPTEIEGAQIITSSGLRTTALGSGDVQASFIHLTQFNQLKSELGDDVRILATFYDDVDTFIKEAFQAPSEWLDNNLDEATALCASVIKGARELASDEEIFFEGVETYVDEPPTEDESRIFFELIQSNNFWPLEGNGFETESLEFMVDVALKLDLISEAPDDVEDLVDRRPLEGAMKMVEEAEA